MLHLYQEVSFVHFLRRIAYLTNTQMKKFTNLPVPKHCLEFRNSPAEDDHPFLKFFDTPWTRHSTRG